MFASTMGNAGCNGKHICFPSLPPMLEWGFEPRLGLEFSGFSRWLAVWGFLRVLRFHPLLHRVIVLANKIKAMINAISTLSNLIAELYLRTTWHSTCCTWWAPDVLHVICTQLRLGHLSVRVGDSSWCITTNTTVTTTTTTTTTTTATTTISSLRILGCDLLDLCLLIPSGTKARNSTPPANSILAGPP